jgi:alpha-N-arabinofuranosidase
LRKQHGSPEPFAIKLWGLGNEMDGPWQVGHKTAEEYGRLACEVAKAVKLFDPSLELVACGSSNVFMPTFPQWEETVLDHAYEVVDYLSLHMYFRNEEKDIATFLACSAGMDSFIETVVHVCDYVKAKKRSKKTMYLCFDEWNVWFHSLQKDKEQKPWIVGPALLEDVYTFEDALVVGCLLNSLLRHCDRVKIACRAQLVNTIAPIMTETGGPAWRQTIYWPFYYASKYGRGEVLDCRVEVGSYENAQYGTIPYADTLLVHHPDTGEIDVFVVNRHQRQALSIELDLSGFSGSYTLFEHIALEHQDQYAVNDKLHPDEVVPKQIFHGDIGSIVEVAPLTWNLLRFHP